QGTRHGRRAQANGFAGGAAARRGLKFGKALVEGCLIRRYKRFLADIQLADRVITAACPNTGSMMGVCEPGSRVWLSEHDNPARKYRHTWELVEVGAVVVGINTGLPNALVGEA